MTKPFEIPKALVWKAFKRVKSNGGSAGIDQESIEEFERNLSNNLYKIWNRMVSGSYVPPPVKAVAIPKKSGGTRTLGVPTVADRIAQTAIKLVLEPTLELIFDRDSFGYRQSGRQVWSRLRELLSSGKSRCFACDAATGAELAPATQV